MRFSPSTRLAEPGIDRDGLLSPALERGKQEEVTQAATRVWSVLAWLGTLFVLVGGLDVALAWYPFGFGRLEWEFGTVTATLNGLLPIALGLVLLLAAGMARQQRWLARSVAVACLLISLLILSAAVLWALAIPMALQALPEGSVPLLGLKKAIVKTTGQVLLYPIFFMGMAVKGWRSSTSPK